MDYKNTDKMLKNVIKDFKQYIPGVVSNISVFSNGNILDINTGNIINIDTIEKSIDSDIITLLEEKLKIKHIIEKEDISEFKSGADKILEDEKKSYGFNLIITVDNIILHESSYCTDDYKYEIDPENAKILILKNIEIVKNSYIKMIMHTFLKMLKSKKYQVEPQLTPQYFNKEDIVVYSGKK